MKVCPKCGSVFSDAFSFCGVDATPLCDEEPADPLLGRAVDRRYRLQEVLGTGGFGSVYRALDERLRRDVAVKILSRSLAQDTTQVERFKREVCTLASLKHPHIIEVFDYGHDRDVGYFIVMEYVVGEDLGSRLARDRRLPVLDIYAIMRQACSALSMAHGLGLVHRDIKSDNIYLATDPGKPVGYSVRLLDFGIVKVLQPDMDVTLGNTSKRTTQGDVVLGTPYSMSPENARGLPIDTRSDIYSLGIVLYDMLTGTIPFRQGSAESVMRQKLNDRPQLPSACPGAGWIPAELDRLVLSMLAIQPDDRPQRVQDVLGELLRIQAPVEDAWALHHLISRRVEDPAEPRKAPAAEAPDRPLVLAVDDDESMRMLVRMVLQSAGCTCITADGGEAALAWLKENPPPDAIVTDVLMPGMDGIMLLRELRERGYAGPIIVCSSIMTPALRTEVEEQRAVRYINKAQEMHRIPEVLKGFGVLS